MAITKANYDRFVAIRNNSLIHSNLQFSADASTAGIEGWRLSDVEKQDDGSYIWQTPYGMLIEEGGVLRLCSFKPTPAEWAIIKDVAFRGHDTQTKAITSPAGVRLELRMSINTEDSSLPRSLNMLITAGTRGDLNDVDLYDCSDAYTDAFRQGVPLTKEGDGIFDFYIYNRYDRDGDLAGNVLVRVTGGKMSHIWIEGGKNWSWTPEGDIQPVAGRGR
jgi:hypothetical protein